MRRRLLVPPRSFARAAPDGLHVEEGCDALARVLRAGIKTVRGEAINLGCGARRGIGSVVRMIVTTMGKRGA